MQPVEQRVGVGRVDPGGRRVRPEQLARRVLDQLLGVAPAQALGGVLVDGGDVVALGRADDGAEGGGGVEGRRGLVLFPAQALSATFIEDGERAEACVKVLKCHLLNPTSGFERCGPRARVTAAQDPAVFLIRSDDSVGW